MGPGLTVLQGYEGANTAQRAGQESQLRQGMSALQLADHVQKLRDQAELRQIYAQHGNDPQALQQALMARGRVNDAEKVGNMHRDSTMRGALAGIDPATFDIERDGGKVAQALLAGGQVGPGTQLLTKVGEQAGNARAMRTMQGDPGSMGYAVAPGSEQGQQLQRQGTIPQDAEWNRANAQAVNEGLNANAPVGRAESVRAPQGGSLTQFEQHPDPLVRGIAMAGQRALAGVRDPNKGAEIIRHTTDQIQKYIESGPRNKYYESMAAYNEGARSDAATASAEASRARITGAQGLKPAATAQLSREIDKGLSGTDENGGKVPYDAGRASTLKSIGAQIMRSDPSITPQEASEIALSLPFMTPQQAEARAKADATKIEKSTGWFESFQQKAGVDRESYVKNRAQQLLNESRRGVSERLSEFGIAPPRSGQPNPGPQSGAGNGAPPAEAIAAIRADSSLAPQFEAKYPGHRAADYAKPSARSPARGPLSETAPGPALGAPAQSGGGAEVLQRINIKDQSAASQYERQNPRLRQIGDALRFSSSARAGAMQSRAAEIYQVYVAELQKMLGMAPANGGMTLRQGALQ